MSPSARKRDTSVAGAQSNRGSTRRQPNTKALDINKSAKQFNSRPGTAGQFLPEHALAVVILVPGVVRVEDSLQIAIQGTGVLEVGVLQL